MYVWLELTMILKPSEDTNVCMVGNLSYVKNCKRRPNPKTPF